MLLTKHAKAKILEEIKAYKEQGIGRRKLLMILCDRFGIDKEFAIDIYKIIMDMNE